jgi:transposase
MRHEPTDHEWSAIKPMLPNKPRGVPRVNDRRVLNGIFWVLRSGAPWRDLPDGFGPYTTCYNRFVRWRRAGVWGRIMDALATAHDASVQMIDTSIVRVHQHGACISAMTSWQRIIWLSFSCVHQVSEFSPCETGRSPG